MAGLYSGEVVKSRSTPMYRATMAKSAERSVNGRYPAVLPYSHTGGMR